MHKIRKCLFPVAGYGTRFLPATKAIPKEMFPIGSKPLIQYAVEEALSCDIFDMVMITNKYKNSIKEHFEQNHKIERSLMGEKAKLLEEINKIIDSSEFYYIEQKEMLGLGHAISCGDNVIQDEPFAVILPDDLCHYVGESVLNQMNRIYQKYPDCCVVAIEEVPLKEVDKYGVIDGNLIPNSTNTYLIESMVEKPSSSEAPSNLAIIGRYILTPDIFEILKTVVPDKNGEIQITDALMTLAKKGKVIGYKFKGKRFDCGTPNGFITAINELSQI